MSWWLPVWIALSSPAMAGCEAPTSTADVQEAIEAIERAYTEVDSARFAIGQNELVKAVLCVDEPVPRYLVAAVHRARGLRAWVEQDVVTAEAAFGAARAIEPAYRFPETMLPARHPIRIAYEDATPRLDTTPIPEPAAGSVSFDGRRGLQRPLQDCTLMQIIDDDGRVVATYYLLPGERLPVYAVTTSEAATTERSARTGWWVGSAVSGALAATTYGIAATRRAAYDAAPVEDKSALRRQTNALVLVSAGLVALAAGSGTMALVQGEPSVGAWPR